MARAIIYSRFSPRRDPEKCESCERQAENCRTYAAAHGLEVAGEYQDQALSGSEEDRPGLWQAIAALRRGDVLLVFKLDRLARDVYLSHVIERSVRKQKATILSVSGEGTWQDAPGDVLQRQILQAFAEYERKVIAARTKAAMLKYQAAGRRMSCRTPYGWQRDPTDDKRLVEHAAEQAVIKRALELRQQGLGARKIARALEAEKAPRRGRFWDHAQVQRMLKRAMAG